jgi:D-alanine-D-alanine ligase
MKTKRIGVLMGGLSAERQVSKQTGEAVYDALRARGYSAAKVFVDRDLDQVLRQDPIDVAFLALHGSYGEDGGVQGMLEMLGIPYTGSGVAASAIAMDKLKSKELFRLHNVPTPPYYVVDAEQLGSLEEIHGSFGYPVFVKPRGQGSSIGAGRADDPSQHRLRCEEAAAFDSQILVERHVNGREITVGLLDGKALGALEIVPNAGVYDYKAKYAPGGSKHVLPAQISPNVYQTVQKLSLTAHRGLGCRGVSRADFRLDDRPNGTGELVCLEVNTQPGMTATSLVPELAQHAGLSFGKLVRWMVEDASIISTAVVSTAGKPRKSPSASPSWARRNSCCSASSICSRPDSVAVGSKAWLTTSSPTRIRPRFSARSCRSRP